MPNQLPATAGAARSSHQPPATNHQSWWNNLQHGGLLLDAQRLTALIPEDPEPLSSYDQDRLRRRLTRFSDDPAAHRGELISFALEVICGFARPQGEWYRGSEVKATWSRRAITGEAIRPRHLWIGANGATLPVFVDDQQRIGVGRGRRVISHVLQWLRQGNEQLALVTNGSQWRLLFAGLDYEAFCQWDVENWFAEGDVSRELTGFRALVDPVLWTPGKQDEPYPLLAAINDSRKGQADLSKILGERVRQAAEVLIQAHAGVLKEVVGEREVAGEEIAADQSPRAQPAPTTNHQPPATNDDIYRAAVRMIMRLVVILFAESREGLLARDNPIFHTAYSLQGLREQLERTSQHKLVGSVGAYPRILALLQLICQGSSHPALPVPAYGGELFTLGQPNDADGMKRALHLFETACFRADVMTDYDVRQILELLTRTQVKIRQGRTNLLVPAPVDFSSLDSEYIGILYEGLLDFQLRSAARDEPIVFLAVGNQPALPLGMLEQMDDRAIKSLLEKLKDTSSSNNEGEEEEVDGGRWLVDGEEEDTSDDEETDEQDVTDADEEDRESTGDDKPPTTSLAPTTSHQPPATDERYTLKSRAETWARHACEVGKLVRKPRGKMTPEKRMQFDKDLDRKARQLVVKVVLPGEWYLIRQGGTRKGSGTFYTRPQLAVPTVHRTLRPLAYDPPTGEDGQPDIDAPTEKWKPKQPEEILNLKVCDPACGSGSFPLAALRFLTGALYDSLLVHDRIQDHGGRAMLDLIRDEQNRETLASEALPCRPEDDDFEPRTKAILRRYVVERCIYGVDLDPLAVELCRLSLWIETLDRSMPLTFLNHKIKCGNSLVGTWFDQFLHYPAMAWEREGGDKNHSNGVHFAKNAWTKAISDFKKRVKPDLIDFVDGGQFKSMVSVDLTTVQTGHDAAEAALAQIHNLGIAQVDQRAARYDALLADPEFHKLKGAFDRWCALWFWPADQLDHAPLPTQFAEDQIGDEDQDITRHVAAKQRFFHWELEFPDVFNASSHGFDAVLGNPPWDIAKPNSKEFFSSFDPLYRGYGKQEAVRKQTDFFQHDRSIERHWLDYCATFKAMSNWVKYAGFPFGDRITEDSKGKKSHDLNIGNRGRSSFATSQRRHQRWQSKREQSSGYADAEHSFRHQGSADINLYKLFLEQAHALLRVAGGSCLVAGEEAGATPTTNHQPPTTAGAARLGLIIPSGLYSDFGTGELRRLFIDHCQWEWLFGFENREKIFDIDSRFKFNPVIIAKGGQTRAIRTAFMRRSLADWEKAEQLATEYSREQVVQFSPKSRAILEIQSQRDLEVLTKIYANSVLLGDQSEQGWGIQYAREFDMTNDSKLFPPRPKWEEWGYRPDEYSRWIKGPWKPVEVLWRELGVDPTRPVPIDEECARAIQEGIKSGEVACTVAGGNVVIGGRWLVAGEKKEVAGDSWLVAGEESSAPSGPTTNHQPPTTAGAARTAYHPQLRCAQPPYDKLPIPRANIPEGIILSREATHFIREDEIPEVTFTDASGKPLTMKVVNEEGEKEVIEVVGPAIALPLYEGRMIGQFDFSEKGWVSGKGRSAEWRDIPWDQKQIEPQFLMARSIWFVGVEGDNINVWPSRLNFMDVTSATNTRTMIAATTVGCPAGNKVPLLNPKRMRSHTAALILSGSMDSMSFDFALRRRMAGTTLNWFIAEETAVPVASMMTRVPVVDAVAGIAFPSPYFAVAWLLIRNSRDSEAVRRSWRLTRAARLKQRATLDAVSAMVFGLDLENVYHIAVGCDVPKAEISSARHESKGFWRVDKEKHPEHRHTVLSLVAYNDLQEKINASDGNVTAGIEAFCNQNDGEGWMLPETLRLADYGLGHDDRAKEHQPVRECFGPRFYDWQLAQSPEESWKECHLHARNLLGPEGYQALLAEIEDGEEVSSRASPTPNTGHQPPTTSHQPPATKSGQQRLFET